jgi:pimeloyl-ACP methyl ester carboxylesterase
MTIAAAVSAPPVHVAPRHHRELNPSSTTGSLYKTAGGKVRSLSADVMDEVRRLMDKYKGEELSITVVGHSLGGLHP